MVFSIRWARSIVSLVQPPRICASCTEFEGWRDKCASLVVPGHWRAHGANVGMRADDGYAKDAFWASTVHAVHAEHPVHCTGAVQSQRLSEEGLHGVASDKSSVVLGTRCFLWRFLG